MLPAKALMSSEDRRVLEEGIVSFMISCKFFSYYFYDQMKLYPTPQLKTAATDGKRIFFNPKYLGTLTPSERCFLLAHEVYHTIDRDPVKMQHYRREGNIRGRPFIEKLYNVAADYRINADLVAGNIGTINPAWLYSPEFGPDMLVEDIYVKLYDRLPPPPPGGRPCDDGDPGDDETDEDDDDTTGSGDIGDQDTGGRDMPTPKTHGEHTGNRGGKRDKQAQANGGGFDSVLPPEQDPATGRQDMPSEQEFREAINRAQAAAAGDMPGGMRRIVHDILSPQVSWRDEIRLKITGKIGTRRETWDTPNRRRLVLTPFVYMPGRQGHGAELITVVIDTSGSISDDVLRVFFSEAAAIINDCKPKRVQVIWCDAAVRRVDEARSLDELLHIRVNPPPGGGGTSFHPPFEYLGNERIVPDTLVYLTDLYSWDGFPDEPVYPVIWACINEQRAPFGDTVRINL